MTIFNTTNGVSWRNSTNWGTGDPCANSWFGISCYNGLLNQLYVTQDRAILERKIGLLTTTNVKVVDCESLDRYRGEYHHRRSHRSGTLVRRIFHCTPARLILNLPLTCCSSCVHLCVQGPVFQSALATDTSRYCGLGSTPIFVRTRLLYP